MDGAVRRGAALAGCVLLALAALALRPQHAVPAPVVPVVVVVRPAPAPVTLPPCRHAHPKACLPRAGHAWSCA